MIWLNFDLTIPSDSSHFFHSIGSDSSKTFLLFFFFLFFFRFPFMFLRWRTLQMSQISSASFTFSPATGPSRKNGCVPKIKAAKSLKKKKNHNNKKKIVIITNKKKQQVIWSALALSLVFFDISLFFYQLFYLYLPVCLRHLAVMIGTVLSVFLSLSQECECVNVLHLTS